MYTGRYITVFLDLLICTLGVCFFIVVLLSRQGGGDDRVGADFVLVVVQWKEKADGTVKLDGILLPPAKMRYFSDRNASSATTLYYDGNVNRASKSALLTIEPEPLSVDVQTRKSRYQKPFRAQEILLH